MLACRAEPVDRGYCRATSQVVHLKHEWQFSESEIVGLTIAIIAINGWNRLAIPFRTPPGSYTRAADGRGAST